MLTNTLQQELLQELRRILDYWATETVDETNGGFIGRISHHNIKDPYAVKGSVLNARILWTFSAAYNLLGTAQYRELATRAWDYLRSCFADKVHGGLYWTVDYTGKVVDNKNRFMPSHLGYMPAVNISKQAAMKQRRKWL
ncbi:AGE family epimerase/isomerase [Chitinophaga pinensis]|uniref:AGE family epimerase/isomerase n=1 Tax=Chitinophaga pinensis TaxID=79329 RepID=UPI0021BDD15A|nr:AGE family epimerase/isomerase [Chitinophaga pinensis]